MEQQKKDKPLSFPDKADKKPEQSQSVNQADGTAADRPRGETQAHAAQFNKGLADDTSSGDAKNKSTDKQDITKKAESKIDPSSPTKSTEGGTTSMPQNPTMDSAGEVGEPTGKGNIEMKDESMNKDNKDKNNQQGNQANKQDDQNRQQNMSGRSDRQDDSKKNVQSSGKQDLGEHRADGAEPGLETDKATDDRLAADDLNRDRKKTA